MDTKIIFSQMTVLLILLTTGFILGKLKILTSDGNRVLTRIVLYVALPCTILNSVFGTGTELSVGDTLYYLLMCFLSFALAFIVAIPVIRLSQGNKENHGLLIYMSVFSNCGFMGFPITLAVFGAASGLYAAIYNIPFNLLSFSVGVMLIAGKRGKFDSKLLINPPLLASVFAIPIALTGFSPHFVITEAVRLLGSVTTPCAMIVIGGTLAFIPVRDIFTQWRIWLITTLRLAAIPLAVWFIFRNFITDEMMLGVLVVLSAMPTAAQSAMLAIQYDGNRQISSAGVFVTTLLCVLTVPVLLFLLF